MSLCHSVLQKSPVSLRPSVLLSSKKHLSHFVIMSLCLQKKHLSPSVPLLFCLQKTSVSLCHYVILSSKKHLSPSVPLLFCLQDHPFCLSCPHVTLSSKLPCLPLSLGHYVGRQRIQNLDKTVQKKKKRGCVYYDTPSFIMLLPRRGNQFSASFSSTLSVFGFWCKTKIMARAMAAVIIPPATQSCPNIASNADIAIRIITIE